MTDMTFLPGEGNPVPPEEKRPGEWPYGAPTPGPGPSPGPGGPLDPEQENAYSLLVALFESWDLGALAPVILELVQQGFGPETITFRLQQTPEYKTRFAANDQRIKNGLPALSPAEYISLERSYRQIFQASGLPPGFYDSYTDFQSFISDDKSPAEIQERVDLAVAASLQAPQEYQTALRDYYGITPQSAAAFFLDRQRAMPILQKIAATANVGAAAIAQGLTTTLERAEQYALRGISAGAAREGFAQVAEVLKPGQALGERYGEAYTQQTAEEEFLGGSAEATKKRRRLVNREVGEFAGGQGIGRATLARQPGSY